MNAPLPQLPPPAQITLRLRLPLLWFVLLLPVAFLLPGRIWNTLLVGLGGLFLIAYLWVRLLADGLHATRRLRYGWVSVGDRLEETFTLINNSPLPALWVEIRDETNVPGYQTAVVRSIGDNSTQRWRESAICQQRGHYQLGPWRIRSSDPFGIFTVTRRYPAASSIVIHPPVHTNLPIPLPPGTRDGRTRAQQRAWQATINAAAVRDYRPNDPYRWIHWRTSARRDDLFVREFDLDAAGEIWIVLDLQQAVQLGHGLDGTEEHAVLLAASLATEALQQNRPVGLAAYGRSPQIVPTGRGAGQSWRILRALALARADGDHPLSQTLPDVLRIARRGSAAIIITPCGDAGWLPALLTLSRQGIRSHITLLHRASFNGEGHNEGLRDAVRRLGFPCQLVRQGEVGQPPEPEERRGYWDFIVTGTGKVVTVRSPV